MLSNKRKLFLSGLVFFTVFFGSAATVSAADFFIDSSYDLYGREEIETTHLLDKGILRMYIDSDYLNSVSWEERNNIERDLRELGKEFENNIYSQLTSLFGKEPSYSDGRIAVVFHQIRQGSGGYFRTGDQYSKYQYPKSNERNALYLNTSHIDDSFLPANLAHEFTHLITFNQKDNLNGVTEEVWLNELRAEHSATYLGYGDNYLDSNLEKRVNDFIKSPGISLTEWTNRSGDYAAVNLFSQYLVDHYGIKVLADSLKSSKIGIESIDYALRKNRIEERFSDIFTDWTIALFLNDCNLGDKYCYKNEHLKDLRINPQTTYLPRTRTARVTVSLSTKEWAGNWQRITGGEGKAVLNFDGGGNPGFNIPYLLCENGSDCSLDFLTLDNEQKGEIIVDNFEKSNLTIIPSIQNKVSGFNGPEKSRYFSFDVLIEKEENNNEDELKEDELKKELLERIDLLKKEIERLKARLAGTKESCQITGNLYFGMMNSDEVRCLQELLKEEGVYPEGLVTGNFLSLTRSAVIRFQEKYSSSILRPLGLSRGTGYVGPMTREKMSSLK